MSERIKAPNIRNKFIDKVIGSSIDMPASKIKLHLVEQFKKEKELESGIVTKFYSEDGKYLFSKKRWRGRFEFTDHEEQFIDESIPGEKEILYSNNINID